MPCHVTQVEKVICYDAFQSPIRNIQRMGRTGRHEAGHVIHILSEGQEVKKFEANIAVSHAKLVLARLYIDVSIAEVSRQDPSCLRDGAADS